LEKVAFGAFSDSGSIPLSKGVTFAGCRAALARLFQAA
jgi:hypothetical protein